MRQLSQAELARRAAVSVSYVRAILGGTRPSDEVVCRIAAALGVQPAHFLEHRLDVVATALRRSPSRLDELFTDSLSGAERRIFQTIATTKERFGIALAHLLAEQGASVEALAQATDLAPTYVQYLIDTNPKPSPELVESIAGALGVPPEHFLDYRAALLSDWLRDDPRRLNRLFRELTAPSSQERDASVPLLEVYVAWPVRELPDPRAAAVEDLLQTVIEIVRIEGPVVGTRIHALVARGAGLRRVTKAVRSPLNRATARAVRSRILIDENETGTQTQRDRVFRLAGTAAVRPRTRGDRRFSEIPLAEVRWLLARLAGSSAERKRALLSAYELTRLSTHEEERLERCLKEGR
jgi:transcriptional regulator with XRE-family HTH domain